MYEYRNLSPFQPFANQAFGIVLGKGRGGRRQKGTTDQA